MGKKCGYQSKSNQNIDFSANSSQVKRRTRKRIFVQ